MSVLTLSAPSVKRDWETVCGMTVKHAREISGGLSNTSKMPCHSYGLPIEACHVGSKARARGRREKTETGSTDLICGHCYAGKNNYLRPNVLTAAERRLASLDHPEWVDAMVCLIGWEERQTGVFRWHDSGDLQSIGHLDAIVEIADRLPWVSFWIPTREAGILRTWLITNGSLPHNLTVRQSVQLIGHMPDASKAVNGRTFSGVSRKGQDIGAAHACPAYRQEGHCLDCRACWSQDVAIVMYPLH